MRGLFDYIPDVKSMAIGVSDEAIRGRNQALTLLLNPSIEQKLKAEGQSVKISELIKQILSDNLVKNADKLFEEKEINEQPELPGVPTGIPNITGAGVLQTSPSPTGIEANTGMANSPITPGESSQVSESI